MSKNRPLNNQPVDARKVRFFVSDLFFDTLEKYKRNVPVMEALLKFVRSKRENPIAPYGAKDKLFSNDGNLKGFTHAGLTFDDSIVYTISGKNPNIITLYGIFSHDDLGTGTPRNDKRQKQASQKFHSQTKLRPYEKIDERSRSC